MGRIKPFRAVKAKKTFNVRLKALLTNYLPQPHRMTPEGAIPLLLHTTRRWDLDNKVKT
jgi:hypothetical protein